MNINCCKPVVVVREITKGTLSMPFSAARLGRVSLWVVLFGLFGLSLPVRAFEDSAWQCTGRYQILTIVETKAGLGSSGGRPAVNRVKVILQDIPLAATGSNWSLGNGGDFGQIDGIMAIVNERIFVPTGARESLDAWLHDRVLQHFGWDIDVFGSVLIGRFKINRGETRTRARLVASFTGDLPTDLILGNVDLRFNCVPA